MVEGVAVEMTHDEISRLDPFEGYPTWYNRVDIQMTNLNTKELIKGQAYIQVSNKEFHEPCDAYK